MAHIHSVYDTDKHFTIEPGTRALVNQTPEKACIMQYDHASERITFDLPAEVEGHKILDCNRVEVHYINIDAKTQEQRTGLYEVDDLQLSPADEAVAICSWLISMNATQLVGPLYFRVTFKCVTDGALDYSWSTAIYKGLTVSDGINCTEYVEEQYADVLAQWRNDLDAAEQSRAAAESARAQAEKARSGAEATRKTNEQNRTAAESQRAAAEQQRQTSEERREAMETGYVAQAQQAAAQAADAANAAVQKVLSETTPADIGALPVVNNAGAHNAIFRGKSLGSAVTAEQWAAISAGTFEDLYIGDYWTIGGVIYRIAAFDYYYKTGDTQCTTHHVTLVPDERMYERNMDDTDTSAGAYVGSKMYTEGLAQAKTTINNAFGAAHILNHRNYLINAATDGYATGGSWYDSTVELMTEQNMFGGGVLGNNLNGTALTRNYPVDKSQYPLFAFRPDMISNRQAIWLRDVAMATGFSYVRDSGNVVAFAANFANGGVRPAFSIRA